MSSLRGALDSQRRQHKGVWYFAEHDLEPAAQPEALEPRSLPGLLLSHVLPVESGWRLVTYWASREEFEGAEVELRAKARIAALVRSGFVHKLAVRKTPFWRRLTPASVLLQTAALLGALAALQTYGSWLFEPPTLTVDLEGPGPVDVLAGAPVEIHAHVYNLGRRERLEVRTVEAWLDAPSSEGADRQRLDVVQPQRTIGLSQDLPILLKSPPLAPGVYPLEAGVEAAAGLLRGSPTFKTRPGEVKVWRRYPHVAPLVPREGATSRLAWLDGVLEVGEAPSAGVDCQLTLQSDHLRFGMLVFPRVASSRPVSHPELQLAQISWSLPAPQTAFYREKFAVSLEGDRDETDWGEVARRIEPRCTERKSEVDE